jgi:hypothetical protein
MAGFDPELRVEVTGNEILVTLPETSYSVTYFKPRGQPWLAAKNIVHEDDPRIAMTSAEFLAKAWKVANDKERAGVDCVRVPLGRPPPSQRWEAAKNADHAIHDEAKRDETR